MVSIRLERKEGDFEFEVQDEKGHVLQTDSSLENGGADLGFRPMQLLLAALGSCSAIDMVSILKKQRQKIDQFTMEIKGEREKDVIPSLWKSITVTYAVNGALDREKVEKAATLSMEKYCSVAETLRRGGTAIDWSVIVNGN
ncbi:MAG: OsmC family protein [Flavisolibacter sp.]